VVAGFGLLAFAISAVFAIAAWRWAAVYHEDRQEMTALADATETAAVVRDDIKRGNTPESVLGARLDPNLPGAALYYHGEQYAVPLNLLKTDLPAGFAEEVQAGSSQIQQLELPEGRFLVAGVPLGDQGDAYFELFTLSDVNRANTSVGVSLAGAVLLTTFFGVMFGRAFSRRALRPLSDVTEAAAAVARGEGDGRLTAVTDPDLGGLARLFDQTAASLRRHVVAEARFASDVSHELRTPLTTILNSMQLLNNRRALLPHAVREPLDLLNDELDRFRRLVLDLLEISRYDSGAALLLEDVWIGSLVRKVADSSTGRSVTSVHPDMSDVSIRADARCLERVVANLVENAETHGGGCVAVRVNGGRDAFNRRVVRIDVEDCGSGVPANLRDRIFERFARGRSTQAGGVGLGLAIVIRHVRAHRGEVRIKDRPGGGSYFVVELPVR
jgi:signal transduction histidine kinase